MTELGEYESKITEWIAPVLQNPKNLASENELREQGRVAIKYFIKADLDESGYLDFKELKQLCDEIGLPMEKEEEYSLLDRIDKDGDGTLNLEEWTRWWLSRISSSPNPVKQQEAIAKRAFARFDTDQSGYLDVAEMGSLLDSLGADMTDDEVQAATAYVDTDNSGQIECDEFVNWWTNRVAGGRDQVSLVALKMRKLSARASQLFHSDIFTAVWQGDEDLVRQFLESERRLVHASDEAQYGEGWGALHYACYRGHESIVRLLLEAGATVTATNQHGFTPLFYAAQQEHIGICEMLLTQGADPTVTGTATLSVASLSLAPGPAPIASTLVPPSSSPQEHFLCPADHVKDHTALRTLFATHVKCKPPATLSARHAALTLSSKGELVLDISLASKTLSVLPIHAWEVSLTIAVDELFEDELRAGPGLSPSQQTTTLRLSAQAPSSANQHVNCAVPNSWFQHLVFCFVLEQLNLLTLAEGNAAAFTALWAQIGYLFNHPCLDGKLRQYLNLEEKVIAALNRSSHEAHNLIFIQTIKNKLDAVERHIKDNALHNTDRFQELISFSLNTLYSPDPTIVTSNNNNNNNETKKSSDKDKEKDKGANNNTSTGELKKFPRMKYLVTSYPKVQARIRACNSLFEGEYSDVIDVVVQFP